MSRYSRKGSEGSAGRLAAAPLIGTATGISPGMDQLPSATITFTPSTYSGKRDLDNVANQITYIATSSPGGLTGSSTSSPITVNGLTPGISYTFTVRATNVLGSSPSSSPSNAILAQSAPPVFIYIPPPPPVFTPPPPVFTPPVFTPPPPVFTPPVFTPPPPVFTPPPPYFVTPPVFTPPPMFTIPPYFVPPPPMFTLPPPPPPMFTPPPPYFVPPPPRFPPPPPRFPPPPPRFFR